MIKFLLKGLLRDRQRSMLPVLVGTLGVMLTVALYCWLKGYLNDSIGMNARFSTGHVKIMTKPYSENIDQVPNDLALTDVGSLTRKLSKAFPSVSWHQRIRFAGLIDAPDKNGETRSQGPAVGFALDLLSGDKSEAGRFNLNKSLIRGRIPIKKREALISDVLAQKLKVSPGDTITFIGSTMIGSMAMYNFVISGTVVFGTTTMDNGSVIADIKDIREALDMDDAAGEIVGYFPGNFYNDKMASAAVKKFSELFPSHDDPYAPVMLSLRNQNGLEQIINQINGVGGMIVFIFVFAMSLVFWNAGLLGGLRRYSEFGTRLAIGEDHSHIYKTMIYESVLIGIIGSFTGTSIGLLIALYLQNHGIDIGSMMKSTSIMIPSVFHARITPVAFFIGFIPGLFSSVAGTALSGTGIYKRKTSQLFKELEA
jgi:putative ABC transport system permease protein